MVYIYLHLYRIFVFIGLHHLIETKPTVNEPENPFQASNKKFGSSDEILHNFKHQNNDYFDLSNFNRQKSKPSDREYDEQELKIGNRSENSLHEVVLGQDKVFNANFGKDIVNNHIKVNRNYINKNYVIKNNSDSNPMMSHAFNGSVIKKEIGETKIRRKEKTDFKHAKFRQVQLLANLNNDEGDLNKNLHYFERDNNYFFNHGYHRVVNKVKKEPPINHKSSKKLRRITNNDKLKNYKFKNLENNFEFESDESSDSSSISESKQEHSNESEEDAESLDCSTEKNESESDSEENTSDSSTEEDSKESDQHESSEEDDEKLNKLKNKNQINAENEEHSTTDHEEQNTTISIFTNAPSTTLEPFIEPPCCDADKSSDDSKHFKIENHKNLNAMHFEKESLSLKEEEHIKDEEGSVSNEVTGKLEDESVEGDGSKFNDRIKLKFLTKAEEPTTTTRLYYVKVKCENCKIRSKIILHNSNYTNLRTKP